jgi:hypothetical protein
MIEAELDEEAALSQTPTLADLMEEDEDRRGDEPKKAKAEAEEPEAEPKPMKTMKSAKPKATGKGTKPMKAMKSAAAAARARAREDQRLLEIQTTKEHASLCAYYKLRAHPWARVCALGGPTGARLCAACDEMQDVPGM